jgi:hypothetical protein
MRNEEGPDFQMIQDLPGLLLVADENKAPLVGQLTGMIAEGIENVLEKELDEKMFGWAMDGVDAAMDAIRMQFSSTAAGGYGPGGGMMGGDDNYEMGTGGWGPELFKDAVCCMEGMDCWTGAFANTAGRAQLEAELARLEDALPELQEHFDDLNLVNVQKAAAELALEFGALKTTTRQLTNQLKDARTRLTNFQEAFAAGTATNKNGEAYTDQGYANRVTELEASVTELSETFDSENARYAQMDRDDAGNQVSEFARQIEEYTETIRDLQGEADW